MQRLVSESKFENFLIKWAMIALRNPESGSVLKILKAGENFC